MTSLLTITLSTIDFLVNYYITRKESIYNILIYSITTTDGVMQQDFSLYLYIGLPITMPNNFNSTTMYEMDFIICWITPSPSN